MSLLDNLILYLPEIAAPKQKRLPFKEKLKWTLLTLVLFLILGMVPLFGLGNNALAQFESLSIILASEFGSILSLGIGPIVTGSIILQLLNGAGILKFDLTRQEDKQRFQGLQKLMAILFVIIEAFIYVFMGGLAPPAEFIGVAKLQLEFILVFQLFLGGMIVLFMDEIVSKWGFGQGISLFIATGVSKEIFIKAFSISDTAGNLIWNSGFQAQQVIGRVWSIFFSVFSNDFTGAGAALIAIVSTIIVFIIAVYAQSMKIEIPLSFGRIRGHGIRWPLHFIYTSNIPVILIASLFATLQLWVRLLQNWTGGEPLCWLFSGTNFCFPGGFTQGNVPVGFISVLNGPNLVFDFLRRGWDWTIFIQSLIYILLMIVGSVIFSVFWVQTSGMDARSQAKQIMSSGLQIPGFRKDIRVVERLLNRYIGPLTIMGAIVVGFLAATADLTGALSRGTGILLTVMIVYRLYEDIAKEHMYDMNPIMRKFMGK